MSEKKLEWEEEALKRLEKIPSFLRSMVVSKLEQAAQEEGLTKITAEYMEQAKARMMSMMG